MRLAILDLSYWPPEYMSGEPRFGETIAHWLARGLPEADLSVIDVVEGAPLPGLADFDGYVVSGSDKGVYDEVEWMAPLRCFLLDAREASTPLLGICFGHQIMADVFGGRAELAGPPEVGVRRYVLEGAEVSAHVWHQDQVTQVPTGAQVIGAADYCPVGALAYPFPALSVQFHPEYTADYLGGFLRRSRGAVLSEAATDAALAQISGGEVAPDLFARRAGDFFRATLSGSPRPSK